MNHSVQLLGVYLHLARASELRRRPQVRDRLLILGGVVAAQRGLPRIAALCRQRVLEHNPHHLVGHWENIESALQDPDFQFFLRQLQRRYPQEKAERLLINLDIDMAQERATYYTDEEYAAALLGTSMDALDRLFGT